MNKKIIDTIKIITLVTVLTIGATYAFAVDWTPPPGSPPGCPNGVPGCEVPINVSASNQVKTGGLGIGGFFSTVGKAVIGHGSVAPTIVDALKLRVFGKVGAEAYCDQNGNNCIIPPGGTGTSTSSSGLWRQIAGTQTIENTNNGKIQLNGKIIITGGKPAKGKVLAAQDETGVARWRYVSELIQPTTQVATCNAGEAIQAINPDGTPVCVNIQNRTTSSGSGFLLSLIPSLILNNMTGSQDADGGGGCRVVNGGSCGVGSFDNRTCLETKPINQGGGCVKTLCCSY